MCPSAAQRRNLLLITTKDPMTRPPQSLHIFRKDLLHLWPETLVVVLLFVAFAWTASSAWLHTQAAIASTLLGGFLKIFLMPVSWLVVITRLIQDESLVGDRQFWTSRPYHWAKLLAAKLLYLFVFLYVPFFLMQVFLLKHAGLYPTLALPALLKNLLLLTVIIVIPLAAIAAVTSTFARMLLTTVGAIIYLLIVSLGVVYLLLRRMPPPGLEYFLYGFIILLPFAVLVYQYATRKTHIARIVLALTPLLIVALLLLIPATALIHRAYPLSTTGAQLAPLPDALLPRTTPTGRLRIEGGLVQVALPFAVSGIDRESNLLIKGLQLTIDAPNYHWSSPYQNDAGNELNAFNPATILPVILPAAVFQRVHDTPADVHLSLAVAGLKAEQPSTWKATLLPFSVPGHGVCSYSAEEPDAPPVCRYPLQVPTVNLVGADLTSGSCADTSTPKVPSRANLAPRLPSALDFDPVISIPLDLRNASGAPQQPLFLCPGTPLHFIEAKPSGQNRLEVTLKQILLDRYVTRISERSQQPTQQPTQPGPAN